MRLPLAIAVTIEFLGPLAALAGSRRWLDAFWAVLAAGGVVLLMEGRGDLNLVGLLFALAAGTCWGLFILVGAALGRHTMEGNGLALGMVVAALVAVPFGVADSGTAPELRADPRWRGQPKSRPLPTAGRAARGAFPRTPPRWAARSLTPGRWC